MNAVHLAHLRKGEQARVVDMGEVMILPAQPEPFLDRVEVLFHDIVGVLFVSPNVAGGGPFR